MRIPGVRCPVVISDAHGHHRSGRQRNRFFERICPLPIDVPFVDAQQRLSLTSGQLCPRLQLLANVVRMRINCQQIHTDW